MAIQSFRKRLFLLSSVMAAGAVFVGRRLYAHRPLGRIPSRESLDDPDAARAFDWVSRLPQMRWLRRYVAHRAGRLAREGEAVDLGCGSGLLAFQLAQRVPGLFVTGVDLSEEMLARARAQALRSDVRGRVAFKVGDARAIPFHDRSLDLVVSTLSLHHWKDPIAVLDEIARTLKPGGSFLILDLRRDLAAPAWLLLWFVTNVVVPRALRELGEPLASRNAAYTPEEAVALASRSQLDDWRVTRGPLWLILEGKISR